MQNFLLSDVAEFHILSFLDLPSILSISYLSKNYNTFINESQIIWENKILNYFNEGTNYDPIFTKELKFYYNKLNIPLLLKINDITLQKNNINYKDLFSIVHYQFTFSKKGFSQSDIIKSFTSTFYPILDTTTWSTYKNIIVDEYIIEDEIKKSIIGYFNGNHTVLACHRASRGNWETIVANKECKVGNIYYWTIHLTRYTPKTAGNAWTILIGVDDKLNISRSNDGLHYWITNGNSKGFGYCIKSDDFISPGKGCSYTESDVNTVGHYIGVCFDYRNSNNAKLTYYIKNGEDIRECCVNCTKYEDNKTEILFRPAVSIVGWQGVTILPWDGNVEILKEMKKLN
ncbi:hypothetical protein ABK040_007134 [Willaertia magna]